MRSFFLVVSVLIVAHGILLYIKGYTYAEWWRKKLNAPILKIFSIFWLMVSIAMLCGASGINIPIIPYGYGLAGLAIGFISLFSPYDTIYKMFVWWVETSKKYNKTLGGLVIAIGTFLLFAVYP